MATYTYNGLPIAGGIWDANPDLPLPPGVAKITSAAAPAVAPAAAPRPSIFPTSVPAAAVASPSITPVSLSTPGSSPVATGVDLFMAVMDQINKAEMLRQNAIDQTLNLAKYASSLQAASPSQAANLAVQLGIPGLEPDLSFTKSFVGPKTTGAFGGRIGTQDISLPFAFSGKELSFLSQNENVATMLQDITKTLGRPDLFKTSAGSLIPTSGSIFKF